MKENGGYFKRRKPTGESGEVRKEARTSVYLLELSQKIKLVWSHYDIQVQKYYNEAHGFI